MENFSNQIYNMDCMDLFRQLPDGCVSMILTDPPYGIQYQNNFSRHPHPLIAGDGGIDYERFVRESFRVLRNNAHAYFFTRFDCYPYHYECLRRAGFSIKNCLVIEKGTVGGSGSTASAAILTGRRYLGAEIDRTYFELAQKRIAETGGQT